MRVLTHFLLYQLGLAKPWTFYTDAECRALEQHAAGKKRLAEIGCWQGVNTSRIRRVMAPDAVLYAIDPYFAGRLGFSAPQRIAHREVRKVQNGTLKWLRMTDLEAADLFRRQNEAPLDFIFSDTLNTYDGFKACWDAWSPWIAPRGIYILANSRSSETRNIDEAGSAKFTKQVVVKDLRFELLPAVGTFTILRRRA
jgi:predicted O-methyltransferase YrrM